MRFPVGGNGINQAILDAADAANRLVGPLTAAAVDPVAVALAVAVDAATAAVETARRPPVEREQRSQIRTERSIAAKIARRNPEPAFAMKALTLIPGLVRYVSRRSQQALAVTPPAPAILRPGSQPSDRTTQ